LPDEDVTAEEVPQEEAAQPPRVIGTETAFLVFKDPNGHWMADSTVAGVTVQAARVANQDDFYEAAATIQKDLQSQQTAAILLQAQQAMAQQLQQRAESMRMAQAAGVAPGGLDLSKLRK
jgi:hypothetical protein